MKKILLIISSFFIAAKAFADQPKDWQLGFQNPASDGMRDIVNFHDIATVRLLLYDDQQHPADVQWPGTDTT